MKNRIMCAMDIKLNRPKLSSSEAQAHQKLRKKRFTFIKELKEELKKVSWTTKDELKLSTKVVVGATFFFGIGIYLFDLVIKGFLDLIAHTVRYIFG